MKKNLRRSIGIVILVLLIAASGLVLQHTHKAYAANNVLTSYTYYDITTGGTTILRDAILQLDSSDTIAVYTNSEGKCVYTVELPNNVYVSVALYLFTKKLLSDAGIPYSKITWDEVSYAYYNSVLGYDPNNQNYKEYNIFFTDGATDSSIIMGAAQTPENVVQNLGHGISQYKKCARKFEAKRIGTSGNLYVKIDNDYYIELTHYVEYYNMHNEAITPTVAKQKLWMNFSGTEAEILTRASGSSGSAGSSSNSSELNQITETAANLYALRVSTGAAAGTNIAMFAVNYIDTNGIARSQYILPGDGTLKESLKLAQQQGTSGKNGYIRQTDIDNLWKLGYQTSLASVVSNSETELTPLAANSTDTYLVNFLYSVEQVTSIDVITDVNSGGGTSSVEWECQGMEFYKVDEVEGIDMIGSFSNSYEVCFKGTKLAKTECSKNTFTFASGQESVFSIRTEEYTSNGASIKLNNNIDSTEAAYDSLANDKVIYLKITMADIYNAGIESFTNNTSGSRLTIGNYWIPETLAVKLNYKDINGHAKSVTVPVVTSALTYAMGRGIIDKSSTPAEIVSQGENLILKLHMYDFASFADSDNLTLYYTTDSSIESRCGIICRNVKDTAQTKKNAAYREAIKKNADSISIYAICAYCEGENETVQSETSQVSVKLDNGTLVKESINANPSYCYFASTYSGQTVSPQDTVDKGKIVLSLSEYSGDIKLPQAGSNRFVFAFKTSDIPLAATASDITLQIGYKPSPNSDEKITEGVNLSTAVREYYGYWPGEITGDDGKTSIGDVASVMGTRQNNWIYAYVELDGVDTFTSVTLTLNGQDEWQCESLVIYQLDSSKGLGERHCSWSDSGLTNGKCSSNRYYYRDFLLNLSTSSTGESTDETSSASSVTLNEDITALKLVELTNQEIYLDTNSPSKKISFESETVVEDVTVVDWRSTDQIKTMTHDQTQQDLKLTQTQKTYTVTVHTGSLEYGDNDDAGSSNYFYFQLVFTSGVSAYVQANQQLASDGFLAGADNTFTIRTNYDYGELIAINVIPDDSTENANPYDKLMIDYIDVSVDSGKNSSIVWEAVANSDNEWVGIDYTDSAQNESSATQSSREIEQLRTVYAVSGRKMKSHLLIAILTGNDTSDFVASSMTGTLNYTLLDGTTKSLPVTPVNAIYSFDGVTPKTETITLNSGNSETFTVSDPSIMFRKNLWDVFIVDIDNVYSIDSLTLTVRSLSDDAKWEVKQVEVYRIEEDNGRKLTKNNEYYLAGKVELVTSCANSVTHTLNNSQDINYRFDFEANSTSVAEATTEKYEQSRVPASANDYLNIAVYMDEEQAGDDYSQVSLTGIVEFTNSYNSYYYASPEFKRTVTSGGRTVFYDTGLGARNMLAVTSISLKASASSGYKGTARVSEIIVQRVRSGTVIETYRFSCGNVDVTYGQYFNSSETRDELTTDYQVVTLQLGTDTDTYDLTAETQDVAVAIRYTNTTGGEDAVYQSEFIYLTDQGYTSVGPNRQVKLTFKEDFVDEIQGIVVAVTGNEKKVNIESASIGTYAESPGAVSNSNAMSDTKQGYECTGWYSVTNSATMRSSTNTVIQEYTAMTGSTLKAESRTFNVNTSRKGDKTAVVPISMTFKTMDSDADRSNYGTTGSIYMLITYKGVDNNTYSREINDITVYTDENGNASFSTGHTDTIRFMEQNMSNIISITLRPYDDDNTTVQTWGLESITLSYGDGAEVQDYTIPVNRIIYEETEDNGEKKKDGALISLKDVILTVTASAKNTETDTTDTVTMTTGENVTYDDGRKYPTIKLMDIESSDSDPSVGAVTFKLTVQNADEDMDGVKVTAKLASGGSDVSNYLSKDEDKEEVYFRPTGTRTTEVTYLVEFTSKANESVVAKVYVVAEPNTSNSSVSVATKDVMEGENTSFVFTLSDTPTREVTLKVTVTNAADTAGTSYTVTIPAGSKVGSLVLKDQPVGDVKATVDSASGGGFSTIDILTANATCVVGAQCDVSLAAADITEGQNAVFTATLSQAAITSMTVSINVNGQTYAIPIQQGQTSGTVTVTGLSAGSYTGTVTAIAGGGFVKVNYGGVNAQITVNKQDAAVTGFKLSAKSVKANDEQCAVTITFDKNCTADMQAVITVTHNGTSEDMTIDIYKGSNSGTVSIYPDESASYTVTLKEFSNSCFSNINTSAAAALSFDATAN